MVTMVGRERNMKTERSHPERLNASNRFTHVHIHTCVHAPRPSHTHPEVRANMWM